MYLNPTSFKQSSMAQAAWALLCLLLIVLAVAAPLKQAFASEGQIPSFSNYDERKNAQTPTLNGGGGGNSFIGGSNRVVDPNTGFSKNTAFSTLCAEGSLTERITSCVQHIITESVETFLTSFAASIQSYSLALIILAVTLFGISILTGTAENPGSDAFMLLIKIGGVLLFTGGATGDGELFGGFLGSIFGVMETFAGFAASYMNDQSGDLSSFIQSCAGSGGEYSSIWAKIDCVMLRLFVGDPTYGLGVGLLWTLLGAVFWTSFIGPFIVIIFIIVFAFLVLLIVRCIFVFLASYAMLALLVIVSPLIIPLLLFRATKSMFDSWLKIFMASMLQPMVLLSFMVFFFAVLDSLFFKENDYSLTAILGPNWEQMQWGPSMPQGTIDWQMENYEAETGKGPGDADYEAYKAQLSKPFSLAAVGNVNLVQEQLIKIELNLGAEGVRDVPVVGQLAGFVEDGANWAFGEVQRALFPFVVTRIEGRDQATGTVILQLMGFSMISLLLIYLMMSFADKVPDMVLRLAGLRDVPLRMVGAVMPIERQIKGAVSGAKQGAQAGMAAGPKGALIGAVAGAAVGAASADKSGNAQMGLDSLPQQSRSNPTTKAGGGAAAGGGRAAAGAGKAATAGKAAGAAAQGGKMAKVLTTVAKFR